MPEDYGQGYPQQTQPQQPMGGQPYYGGYPQGGQQMPAPMNGQYGYPGGPMPKKGFGVGGIVALAICGVAVVGLVLFVATRPSSGGRDVTGGGTTTTTTGTGAGTGAGTEAGAGTGAGTTGGSSGSGATGTGDTVTPDGHGVSINLGDDDGDVQATGSGSNGSGWVTYRSAEAAAQDIGYTLEIPTEMDGTPATDFLVKTGTDGNKYLWFEYWNDSDLFEEFGVVAKMKGNIPPMIGSTENDHEVQNGGNAVIVCGDDDETTAIWMAQDATGDIYGYAAHFNKKMTDEEMVAFVNKVK